LHCAFTLQPRVCKFPSNLANGTSLT